jgi:hypothetical protein
MTNGGKTGWPAGLLQDDDRRLSRWFASRLDARAVVRNNLNERKLHMTTLESDLRQFTGTEQYHFNPFYRWMQYTDGVKYFAEKAGAYWFLDIIGTELLALTKNEEFMAIDLIVRDGKFQILVTDGNDTVLKKKTGNFTDCPTGVYRFFLTNNVLMVTSEY